MIENLIKIDKEIDIKMGLIDPPPWGNPKVPVTSVYRRGLFQSLLYIGNRDRFLVWPNPQSPSRFINLNGNQRYRLIWDALEAELIANKFQLPEEYTPAQINEIKSDPSRADIVKSINQHVCDFEIPVQVVTHLKPGKKLTYRDAMTITLTWDRNHASYDEAKVVEQYREVQLDALKEAKESQRLAIERRLKEMIRPERVFLMPTMQPQTQQPDADNEEPGSSTVDGDSSSNSPESNPSDGLDEETVEKWGSIPADSRVSNSSQSTHPLSSSLSRKTTPLEHLIPFLVSLTPEGYTEITNNILRSKSHLFREAKLKQALEKLSAIAEKPSDLEDSAIVEIALKILNKQIGITESETNAKPEFIKNNHIINRGLVDGKPMA